MNESEQLESCIRELDLMLKNNEFWEHFTDHMIIAFAFFGLGILFSAWLFIHLLKRKIKFDYDIPKGTIMRFIHGDKKWFIVRPVTTMQFFDIIVLCFFDRGKDKFIDKHSHRRVRIVTICIVILIVLFALSGITLLFSALAVDVNIFNRLKGWFVW